MIHGGNVASVLEDKYYQSDCLSYELYLSMRGAGPHRYRGESPILCGVNHSVVGIKVKAQVGLGLLKLSAVAVGRGHLEWLGMSLAIVVWGTMVLVFGTFVVSYWRTSDETKGVGNSCDVVDNCGVWDK